ncbi:MAG: DNA-binding transcriptional regulator [Hafnia sp.]
MFHCPLCKNAAHARSSRYITDTTKERYHQCQNINCGHTFKTMETFESSIMLPGTVIPAKPHPERNGQQTLWM